MKELTQSVIEKWVSLAGGKFTLRDIREELRIDSEANRGHLRVIMQRLVERGIVSPEGRDGTYRKVDLEAPEMDLVGADPTKVLPLKFPFGLEEHARLFPRSVVILTGDKNVGKSGYLYNFLKLNMNGNIPMDLFSSETGAEQMRERFESLGIPIPPPFGVYERYDNFADVVNPDHITVIDYMDFNSEVYLAGDEIDRIFRKIRCAAIIALQKPPPQRSLNKHGKVTTINRDLAYGGGFTAKRAVLYITMSENLLKLKYVKNPAQRGVNPNNMQWTFRMSDDGCSFTNIKPAWEQEEELPF